MKLPKYLSKTANNLILISTFALDCLNNCHKHINYISVSGLYIHIPFCESRCIYCGFYSTTNNKEQDNYVGAICREMELRKDEAESISTVYLGGGTPSLLSPGNLHKIFHNIDDLYSPNWKAMEVTIECNPDDITSDFCSLLRDIPVNRVSMGAQTFSDDRLRFLRRRHNAKEVSIAFERLRDHGIRNISVDLMFAFPNETLDEWSDDIDKAIGLHPEHISAYSLQYEEGTPLYRLLQKGMIREIDDELYRRMYSMLCERLEDAGYGHYEISNFAMPGYQSRHNSSYWHNIPYIGLGASAHSYSGSTRSWNISDLHAYISAINSGCLPSERETITPQTHYDDIVMTALRTREGIDLSSLQEPYRSYIKRAAQTYIRQGCLQVEDNHLALTKNGIFISDMIMADLMWE